MKTTTIEILSKRIARLEAKFLKQCQGIKGFHKFIGVKIKEVDSGSDEKAYEKLMKLRGMFSSKVDIERKNLSFSARKLDEAVEHIDDLLGVYERSLLLVKGQSDRYNLEMGLSGSQTVLSSPIKEAQIVLGESVKKPSRDLEEAREKIEEAKALLEGIRTSLSQI